jgi:hypothetical protein
MSGSTRVMKRVGCDRNDASHIRVESLDEVSINYVAQPHHQGTVMAATLGKCKTLRNLPSGHGIELGFFIAIKL